MNGITNAQQQGGGGGSAASYKAIKSTLTPSDWQEVAKQPYFVGSNAMEWPIDDAFGAHAKRSNDIIGLTSGVDYTISVTVDGQVYTKTAQILDTSQTGGVKVLSLSLTDDNTLVVSINDDASAMMPDVSSFVIIQAPTTVTSFVITSFTGGGFDSSGKAIISDIAIKVNSAVTMYTNTSEKIAVGEKTNGNVTLIAPSIPTTEIPYSLEIVGTDTEGLFEIVNGYVPEIPDTPSGVPQWHTIYESSTPVIKAELSEAIQAGKLYKITISGQEFITWAVNAENLVLSIPTLGTSNGVASSTYSSVYQFDCGIKSYDSTSTANTFKLKTASQYMINASGIQDIQFLDNDTTSRITFTKVEVYR